MRTATRQSSRSRVAQDSTLPRARPDRPVHSKPVAVLLMVVSWRSIVRCSLRHTAKHYQVALQSYLVGFTAVANLSRNAVKLSLQAPERRSCTSSNKLGGTSFLHLSKRRNAVPAPHQISQTERRFGQFHSIFTLLSCKQRLVTLL